MSHSWPREVYSTLDNNFVQGSAGADAQGGAIFNQGTLTINNSTLSDNFVKGGFNHTGTTFVGRNGMGGGIYLSAGTLTINSSTLAGNRAYSGAAPSTSSGPPPGHGGNGYGGGLYAAGGKVHITSSDAKAVPPANYTFQSSDQGVHSFLATLKTAGTQSITVKDTSASFSGSDTGITVNPAAASKFIITAPSSVKAGVAFSMTLTVEDVYGNVVTGYTRTVHFSGTDTRARLPKNHTFAAADKGVHTCTGLILRKKGSQKITITDTHDRSLTGSIVEDVL
jgi:hypothetical protein